VKKSETPFWFECDLSLIYCTSAQFAAALCFFTSFDRMTRVLFPKRMCRLGKVSNRRAGGDLASDMNVVEPILFQARNDPPAPAMCAPGTSLGIINYARLARFILSIGHRAIRLGIAPNAVVAIRVKDNIFHAAIALGLMHIGAATISVGAAFPPDLTSTSFSLIPLKLSPMDETQRSSYSRFFSSYRLGSGGDFGHMLYVLSRGGTIFFPGASTIETLQTLELYKVQGLIASPGWLSVFLKHYDDSTDFRSGFEVILSTGSALSASLSQRVRARLCSNLIFYYGTTETSTISSALAYALYEGAAGYIAPGVTVRVIDSEGKILGPDNEGLLLVRTLVSVDRYLNEFAEAKTPFRDGYFDTGDIGCVTSEKMLVITGHKKGVLNPRRQQS
jgi:hypothetical protein